MQLDIKKREPSKGFQTLHIHHKENSLPPQIQPKRVKEEKEKKKQYSLSDFQILTTLGIHTHTGTGTFGRVRLVRFKESSDLTSMALKILKKTEIIRLKQVVHVQSEKKILQMVSHPFLIKLYHC